MGLRFRVVLRFRTGGWVSVRRICGFGLRIGTLWLIAVPGGFLALRLVFCWFGFVGGFLCVVCLLRLGGVL